MAKRWSNTRKGTQKPKRGLDSVGLNGRPPQLYYWPCSDSTRWAHLSRRSRFEFSWIELFAQYEQSLRISVHSNWFFFSFSCSLLSTFLPRPRSSGKIARSLIRSYGRWSYQRTRHRSTMCFHGTKCNRPIRTKNSTVCGAIPDALAGILRACPPDVYLLWGNHNISPKSLPSFQNHTMSYNIIVLFLLYHTSSISKMSLSKSYPIFLH